MKKLLSIIFVLFVCSFIDNNIVHATDKNNESMKEIEEQFNLPQVSFHGDSNDMKNLTQYYSFNVKTDAKTKLNLPYSEVILAVNDSFIVYGGIYGNIYTANRTTKDVKKIDYVGKGTYRLLNLNIWKLKDNWMYYSYRLTKDSGSILCKTNIETGEKSILDVKK